MPVHKLTSLALLLKKSSWCMTYAIPFSEYMTFYFNLFISLGPSGCFLSYEQIVQLWQLFLSSYLSLLLFPSYLGGSGAKWVQCSQTAPTALAELHYALHSSLQPPTFLFLTQTLHQNRKAILSFPPVKHYIDFLHLYHHCVKFPFKQGKYFP